MAETTETEEQVSEDDWAAAMGEQAAVDEHGRHRRRPRSDFRGAFPRAPPGTPQGFDMILDIPVHLTVELGRTKISIRNLLQLAHGSVVEFDGLAGEPMDVLVNGTLIAQGEVVVVNEKFGIRLTDIITPQERIRKLNRCRPGQSLGAGRGSAPGRRRSAGVSGDTTRRGISRLAAQSDAKEIAMPARFLRCALALVPLLMPMLAEAQVLPAVTSSPAAGGGTQWSLSIQTLLLLTGLTFLPALLLMMTSFTRIIIVLSLLRHALGTQTSPPNQVLIGLSLFLTFFIMAPVTERIYADAYLPLSENKLSFQAAVDKGAVPLRAFMLKQVREADLATFTRVAKLQAPAKAEDIPMRVLIPGLRHLGAEDGLPDRLHRLHTLPDHRHGGRLGAHVDGHDDDVAGDRRPAVQDHAFRAGRRLEPADRLAGPKLRIAAMTPTTVIEIGRNALEITLLISAPLFIAALVTGLIISIFQAATQINETTLSFVPKLVVILITLIVAGPWMITMMTDYMRRLYESIPAMIG
jgi:flagellar biosynthetic protein FliP